MQAILPNNALKTEQYIPTTKQKVNWKKLEEMESCNSFIIPCNLVIQLQEEIEIAFKASLLPLQY